MRHRRPGSREIKRKRIRFAVEFTRLADALVAVYKVFGMEFGIRRAITPAKSISVDGAQARPNRSPRRSTTMRNNARLPVFCDQGIEQVFRPWTRGQAMLEKLRARDCQGRYFPTSSSSFLRVVRDRHRVGDQGVAAADPHLHSRADGMAATAAATTLAAFEAFLF